MYRTNDPNPDKIWNMLRDQIVSSSSGNYYAQLAELTRNVATLQAAEIVADQVSDITPDMGLMHSGEFRSGNGYGPGDGFTGVRIGYPGFDYGEIYNVVGVSNDTIQFGLSATTGKALAGGGIVVLDANGITISPGSTSPSQIKWVTSGGTTVSAIHSTLDSEIGALIFAAYGVSKADLFAKASTTNLEIYAQIGASLREARENWNYIGITLHGDYGDNSFLVQENFSRTTKPIWIKETTAPDTPSLADYGSLFALSSDHTLHWKASDGTDYDLTETTSVLTDSAQVSRSGTEATADGTAENISFDTEVWDTNGLVDISTNPTRITIQTAGRYMVSAYVGWATNSTADRRIRIFKNGATVVMNSLVRAANGSNTHMLASDIILLAASDYLELEVYQTSGGALDVLAGARMSVQLLAAT